MPPRTSVGIGADQCHHVPPRLLLYNTELRLVVTGGSIFLFLSRVTCFGASQRFPVSVRALGGSILRFNFLNLFVAGRKDLFLDALSTIQLLQLITAYHPFMYISYIGTSMYILRDLGISPHYHQDVA